MSGLEMILTGALDAAIGYALVVGLAAVGEMVTERAGLLNIGLEGVVLMGSFGGFALAYATGLPWMGLVGGLVCGGLFGLIMAVWSVTLKTEQVINGLLLFMVATGLSSMLYKQWFMFLPEPPQGSYPPQRALPHFSVPIPGTKDNTTVEPTLANGNRPFPEKRRIIVRA